MKYLVSLFLILSVFTMQAQKVTGYWYGQANVEMSGIQNNYLTELIISQKGNKVKGFFGYYFKDVYESFVVKGTYDAKTRKIIINDIPIIYFQTNSTMNSVDCITSFYGTLRVSKVKTELNGYFYRDKKYMYTCPDLRVNYTLYAEAKVDDSIFKDMSATHSFWKPSPPPAELVIGNDAKTESEMKAFADASLNSQNKQKKDPQQSGTNKQLNQNSGSTGSSGQSGYPATASTTVSSQSNNNTPSSTGTKSSNNQTGNSSESNISSKNQAGSSSGDVTAQTKKLTTPSVQSGTENKTGPVIMERSVVQSDILKINTDFKKRKQIVSKQIEVSSDSVRLSFYDNAEVDGDSISVFLNGKLVIAHQLLTERAFNVYVQLDSSLDINEVSMFAENLGKYPPNTALMVISDGDKRYETYLSSDFKGNATIRLKLKRNSLAGN